MCGPRPRPNSYCSLTKTAAIPIPDPIHILVTKTLPPVCLAMFNPVAIWREPAVAHQYGEHMNHGHEERPRDLLQPRGCPMAIAPPFKLTFSNGMPIFSME